MNTPNERASTNAADRPNPTPSAQSHQSKHGEAKELGETQMHKASSRTEGSEDTKDDLPFDKYFEIAEQSEQYWQEIIDLIGWTDPNKLAKTIASAFQSRLAKYRAASLSASKGSEGGKDLGK